MRIRIELTSTNAIILPRGYNQFIQALIYNHLNEEEARWLHEQGFTHEKRSFKLFTFSDIPEKGNFDTTSKLFTFPAHISFFITSPVDWILKQLANNILSSESVRLGHNTLTVKSIEIIKTPAVDSGQVKIKTLSPIEVHSTFSNFDGKKKTHYYSPFEDDFGKLVNDNLQKKWLSFKKSPMPGEISLKPLFSGSNNEKIRFYGAGDSPTVVKGWFGSFRLQAAPEIIGFALDAGLGSRSSQGFGCVEVVG